MRKMTQLARTLGLATSLVVGLASLAANAESDVAKYVNPFIGTSNFGATHPGAQYPHGLASITPFNVAFGEGKENKFEKDAAWNSRAYIADNKLLTGFSNTNLSGVGCPDLGSILLMPTTGERSFDPEKNATTYTDEQATPGYYKVSLDKHKVDVELTSTARTTLSRYHFPKGAANVLVDLGLALTNETGAIIKRTSATEITGVKTIGTFCYHPEDVRPVYFVAQVNKTPIESGTFKKMPKYKNVEADWVAYNNSYKPYPDYPFEMAGDQVGAYFSYQFEEPTVVEVKVGISYVSIENARLNLKKEQPDFDFAATRKQSREQWNKLLGRVQLKGKEADKRLFYSALYHMLVHPNILNDVNGEYPKMNYAGVGKTSGSDRYTVFSLWDTSRNLHPFLSLVYPELQSAMVNSMVDIAKESGWLPKWELLGMETDVMVGDPATVVIADTYLRGIRDFDVQAAYQFARKASDTIDNNPLRRENADYNQLGYVPVDDEGTWDGVVSTSLEYYLADWNLAQLAKALGDDAAHKHYLAKSMGYKKLFDPASGMLRPKHRDGRWFAPYDPELGRNFEPAPGYVEGNAWNYRFYVPHDMPGLIDLLGDSEAFLEQLDKTFSTDNFDMANEPDITYPFLYHFADGQAHRSSARVNELIDSHFFDTPGGIPGNDDAGTLSAWLAFSMLGIYPVTPGDTGFSVVTPQFDRIEIDLSSKYYSGKSLVITNSAGTAGQASQVSFNGIPLTTPFISHQMLVTGGELNFRPTN